VLHLWLLSSAFKFLFFQISNFIRIPVRRIRRRSNIVGLRGKSYPSIGYPRSRYDNDPRPFNDLPKAYWHGTQCCHTAWRRLFLNTIIIFLSVAPRPARHKTGRGYLTRIITNTGAYTIIPLDFPCIIILVCNSAALYSATADFSIAKPRCSATIMIFFFSCHAVCKWTIIFLTWHDSHSPPPPPPSSHRMHKKISVRFAMTYLLRRYMSVIDQSLSFSR